jgi:hypothetical protein
MLGNSLPLSRRRHSSSHKSPRVRNRILRNELLEPRTLLSGYGLSAAMMVGAPPHPNAALSASINAPPTLAQSIYVNGSAAANLAITGKSASLSVLGKDDGGESKLVYNWSVTASPLGGTATFNINGTNAAKYATATFTKAGTYSLAVRIVDAGGLSVSSAKTVIVTPKLTSVSIATPNGKVLGPSETLSVSGTSQTIAAQGLDQFGYALSTSPTFRWSTVAAPSGAPAPRLTTNGAVAMASFGKAGAYSFMVQAQAGGVSLIRYAPMSVTQVVSAVKNVSTTPVNAYGVNQLLTLPTFVDQFANAMAVTPALTWSTTSRPQGAPQPTFYSSGSLYGATFGMAGNYVLSARVTGAPAISFSTTVIVNPVLTSIAVSPKTVSVLQGATQQFTAGAFDQFCRSMVNQPVFTWTTTAGTVSASGLFKAPTNVTGCTVTAKSGSVSGMATVTILANSGNLQNAALAKLVQSLDVDGSINRQDMIQILRSTGADGVVDTAEFADLKKILTQAATLNIPGYVQVLAGDVVSGNAANATFQGQSLGNLAAGSSATQLNKLVDKWFLGADHPTLCNSSLVYKSTAGSLFPHTPSHSDEFQGQLGDCYFISALGTLADSSPAAVQNMFIDNGDGTFTVRFYTGPYGTIYNYSDGSISAGFTSSNVIADYVTVDRMLPTSASGILAYADYGANYTNSANSLWIPLAEKAYAQWNQTGKEGRDGLNAYASIQGGWMATVDAQVLGYNATDYIMTRTDKQVAISALTAHKAVTIGTLSWSGTNCGLYPSHAYAIVGYKAATDTFTLYNPWGSNQPGQLTWSQLQTTCSQLCVAGTSGSLPISGVVAAAVSVRTSCFAAAFDAVASMWPSESAVAGTVPQSGLAPTAARSGWSSAATNTSHKPLETCGSSWMVQSRHGRPVSPMHDALSAPLVDATFAAEDLVSQTDMWTADNS